MRFEDYAEEEPVMCDYFGDELYDGDEYYYIDGDVVAVDNLTAYINRFYDLKTVSRKEMRENAEANAADAARDNMMADKLGRLAW